MKKRMFVIAIIILIVAMALGIYGVNKKQNQDNGITTVKVNEVTRSVFYAPQYVAINNGYFEKSKWRFKA